MWGKGKINFDVKDFVDSLRRIKKKNIFEREKKVIVDQKQESFFMHEIDRLSNAFQ